MGGGYACYALLIRAKLTSFHFFPHVYAKLRFDPLPAVGFAYSRSNGDNDGDFSGEENEDVYNNLHNIHI